QERGLLVDTVVGPDTWEELVEAGYRLGDRVVYLRFPYFRGDDVRELQTRLSRLGFDPGREDGILGTQTDIAIHEFQHNVGLVPDGIVGQSTLEALDRLRPASAGLGRTTVRETEAHQAPADLTGRRVAIDPGHGPQDPGATGPTGLTEAEAALRIAERLADTLRRLGAEPVMLRGPKEDPSYSERAERANHASADVLVSIHLNSHRDPAADGSSSYFFGRPGAPSVAGRALAELVQEEITAATGLADGRTHAKSFPILRETQMPAVQVEPCFITNPKEERLLREEALGEDVAGALARALRRFFGSRPLEVDEVPPA
ncbi:MAG: N-acetylmuramoyl-L-alanine amidase, partial [Actinomycetota bacterium]